MSRDEQAVDGPDADDPGARESHVRVREYAELEGAKGDGVRFRPQRYRPADFGPVRPEVEVHTATGAVLDCAMHDVSQNGVSVEWSADHAVALGDVVPTVVVSFDRHEAYRGAAAVSSLREAEGRRVVGVSFTDSLMDVDDVLLLRDVKDWGTQGARGLSAAARPWQVEGFHPYKALVAEFGLFLSDAAAALAAREASLPWHVVHGDTDAPARGALLASLREQFVTDFLRFHVAIDAAVRGASPAEAAALKEFSLRHLQHHLLQSPFMHRAHHKPLGYPGDFELMRFIYDRPFEGASLFAKAVHMAAVATPGAALVRSRRDMLRNTLAARIAAATGRREPVRICSIAAGPAQEIYELLAGLSPDAQPVEVVLFDQDHGALAYAYARIRRLVDARALRNVKVTYLHDSIKRLLRDPEIFAGLPPFDAIVCAGLFDYLDARNATAICRSFVANLAPGGTAYVGNVVPEMPTRWLMEHHLDWVLRYKTRDEMRAFATQAAPSASVALLEEPLGWNPFVTLTRA